jgi:hypothetical protein
MPVHRGQEWGRRACRCPRAARSSPRGRWALKRGGPGPRGRWALERSRPHPRGRLALERGGPRPRGCWALERGRPCPKERLTLERGEPRPRAHPPCHPGGPRGPPGSWSCRARVLGLWVSSCLAFFAGFKRISPCYLGDPHGCPRQA